jgi:hypothetical protein
MAATRNVYVKCQNAATGERISINPTFTVLALRQLVCARVGLDQERDVDKVKLLADTPHYTILLRDDTTIADILGEAYGADSADDTTLRAARVDEYAVVFARAFFAVRWWLAFKACYLLGRLNTWLILLLTVLFVGGSVYLASCAAEDPKSSFYVYGSQLLLAFLAVWGNITQPELRYAIRRIPKFGPWFLLPQ